MIGWVMSWYTRLWMGLKRCWSLLARSVLNPAKKKWDYNSSSYFFHFLKVSQTTLRVTQHHKLKFSWYFEFKKNSNCTLIKVYDLVNDRNWLKKLEFSYLADCYIFLTIRYKQTITITYIFPIFWSIQVLPLMWKFTAF